MTAPDAFSYDRAAARIGRILGCIAVFGTAVATLSAGWLWGAGFAIGSVISGINYYLLKRTVASLGGGAQQRRGVFLGFRYLLLGGAAYAILKLTPISLKAVFAGVFVLTAAVFVEVAIEIIYGK